MWALRDAPPTELASALNRAIEGVDSKSVQTEYDNPYSDSHINRLPLTLYLVPGLRVLIISNVAPHERIVNGTLGTVVGWTTRPSHSVASCSTLASYPARVLR